MVMQMCFHGLFPVLLTFTLFPFRSSFVFGVVVADAMHVPDAFQIGQYQVVGDIVVLLEDPDNCKRVLVMAMTIFAEPMGAVDFITDFELLFFGDLVADNYLKILLPESSLLYFSCIDHQKAGIGPHNAMPLKVVP